MTSRTAQCSSSVAASLDQIAEELARSHEVHLSIGSRQTPLPQRLLGRDLFRYLEASRVMATNVESRSG